MDFTERLMSNIRFLLEMVVQAYYIDSNHQNSGLDTKLEILKEIGDKREYRAASLIEKLGIGDNKELQAEYKSLSKQIHASYDSFYKLFPDLICREQQKMLLINIKQCEILDINLSLRKLFDIFFFLFFLYFSECIPELNAIQDIKTAIGRYNFKLLEKLLNKEQRKQGGKLTQ